MVIKFFQQVIIVRPTIGEAGDLVVPPLASGSVVSGAIFDRRRKAIVPGQGESISVTGIGFFAADADILERDQVTVSGQARTFEVLAVVSGQDASGRIDHVGVELTDT